MVQCTGVAALPPGNASVNVTPVAFPRPVFDTVTVNPIDVPADTESASAVLATSICAQFTVSDAVAGGTDSLFVAATVAELLYVLQLAAVVALVTWTEFDAPDAMSPNVQFSVWLGAAPEIEHVPEPAYAGPIDQLTPSPAGSGSVKVTPVAVPGPELDTVTVNPIGSPVFTGDASAVLVIARSGQLTVTDAVAGSTVGWFVAAAVAELG